MAMEDIVQDDTIIPEIFIKYRESHSKVFLEAIKTYEDQKQME